MQVQIPHHTEVQNTKTQANQEKAQLKQTNKQIARLACRKSLTLKVVGSDSVIEQPVVSIKAVKRCWSEDLNRHLELFSVLQASFLFKTFVALLENSPLYLSEQFHGSDQDSNPHFYLSHSSHGPHFRVSVFSGTSNRSQINYQLLILILI